MAHELTIRRNGTAEMAYAGEGAWHGLGQQLQRGASIEEWQRAAGMDWRIKRSKVRYLAPGVADRSHLDTLEIPDQHVLFRSDTNAHLGIVSDRFQVVQPKDVLEFFRDLVGTNGFELETAGTLFGGRRFWALANIGETAVIGHADIVGGYLLLSTSCDGTMATSARFTTVRVVCNNTLSMALSAKAKHEIKVTHRSTFKPEQVKDRLGLARGQFQRFVTTMRELSTVGIANGVADKLTLDLFEPDIAVASGQERNDLIEKTRDSRGYKAVMDLFVNKKAIGSDLVGARGTAWGWINAVTEYIDHGETGARNYDNQLNSAWFGKGDETKTRAVELALSMA